VIGLFCLVLVLAGVLVAHVWKQNVYVRLSIDLVKLEKRQEDLRNEIALLEVSVGSLSKLSRLETLARNRFGLEYVKAPVLIYMDADSSSRGRRLAAANRDGLQAGGASWPTNGL
jgi:cell division protein FtsL